MAKPGLKKRRWHLWSAAMVLGVLALYCAMSVTDRVLNFPRPVKLKLELGESAPRVSRRVVVIVVDGLTVEGTTRMPFLETIRRSGADFVVRTETPSYSRPGYTVLGTGAKPEVSGISSNDVLGKSVADSIFQRAHDQGMKTAFVGYSWWLEIFGNVFHYASTESSWGPKNKVWTEKPRESSPLPADLDYRVLNSQGKYQKIDEDWERFIQREKLYDVFGNPRETSWNEDDLRGLEAVRILRESGPDLLYLHLHSPDAWGHDSASHQSADYFRGCQDADRSIERVAKAMDFSRETLIVTSDHGFSSTVRKAGHGGWEDSCSLVPMILVGRGIKGGVTGRGRQLDLVPTIAVLLGLPFPTSNQGDALWSGFQLKSDLVELNKARWIKARQEFLGSYAKELGLNEATISAVQGRAEYGEAIAKFRWERAKMKLTGMLVRGLAIAFLVLSVFITLRRVLKLPLLGFLLAYGVFEGAFLALHFAFLGVYSFSVAASGPALGQAVLTYTVIASAAAFLALHVLLGRGIRESLELWWASLFFGALIHSGVAFVLLGVGPERFMSHGLLLYGAIIAHTQTFLICLLTTMTVAIGLCFLGEKAKEELVELK